VALNLHKSENQAKLSVVLAVVGGLATIVAIGLLLRNFKAEDWYVTYQASGLWFPLLGAALGIGLLCSTFGFFVGLISAGKRRNTATSVSWMGFFLSAFAITLGLCAGLFFYFTRNPVK
jgi:hypothetical protein